MKKELSYFIGFWITAWVVMYLSFLTILDPVHALRNSSGFLIPLILPVTILEWCFVTMFHKKRFLLYGLLSVAIVAGFGLLNFYTIKYLVKDPEAESNTVLSIIIFFIVFRGIKFFRTGARQQLALNESRAQQLEASMKLQQMEASKMKAELDAIKSQINPHFLYNSLNAIYSLVLLKSETAGEALLQLSSLMRYVLESSNQERVRLDDEVGFIQDYLGLERLRLEDSCTISFETDMDSSDSTIAPLLLLPLVENCFKHGVGLEKEKNRIEIKLHNKQSEISFSVQNQLQKPYPAGQAIPGKSLENLKKRLDLLYPDRHHYQAGIKDSTYLAQLNIDLR